MAKFQIFPPTDADYPLTVIWVEDRKDHYVRKEEVIAVLNSASGWINISAPFPGIIDAAEVARGDRLKERKALLVLRQEAVTTVHTPGEAAPLREEQEADQPPAAAPQKPEPEKKKAAPDPAAKAAKVSQKRRLGFGDLALLGSFALVGWVVYDHVNSPYSGPLSEEAMAAVDLNPQDLAPREEWGAAFPGQGMIVLQDRIAAIFGAEERDYSCGAAMIADNFAAFDASCFSKATIEETGSGGRAVADFLFRTARDGQIIERRFAVRAFHYWGFGSEANTVALAELEPPPGGDASARTGLSGYLTISTSEPPAFVEQTMPLQDLAYPQEVKGLRYWSSEGPSFEKDKLLAVPLIFAGISPMTAGAQAGQTGLLRVHGKDGKMRFAGFARYRREVRPPKNAEEENQHIFTVSGRFFSDADYARMDAVRKGSLAPGATRFRLDSDRQAVGAPITLTNTCPHPVTFNFINMAKDKINYIDVDAWENLSLSPLNLGPEVYYSVDTGSPTAPDAKAIAFNGTTYHMQPVNLDGVRLGLIARDCR
ncbi:Uncharacterised protein [Pannonibacter phragmitetus]|uniref:Uncharacterized protein n=1 Tax=Pannonibacter phragmitetus TaxID=121719 RepID=A0A379HJW9_9HYPH|nr:hypothetical protein [Pannonibacter phragmitetus]SUC82796.1 Uncharacterised protein [Pannonibacter phragmitetus]